VNKVLKLGGNGKIARTTLEDEKTLIF